MVNLLVDARLHIITCGSLREVDRVRNQKAIYVFAVAVCFLLTGSAALAGIVNMDRMLREHLVYVASTETEEELAKYFLKWRPREIEVMPLASLYINQNSLKDGGFVFWLIARNHTRMIPEEEAMLPAPESGIASDEVIVYASKTGYKRNTSRAGKWDVIVSAPNEKWLHHELERMTSSGMLHWALDERGTLLASYKVQRLLVVSNIAREHARDWAEKQNAPGKNAVDYDFVSLSDWNPILEGDCDTLFLLNTDSPEYTTGKVRNYLPPQMLSFLESGVENERAVVRERIENSNENYDYCVVAAPGPRHIKLALEDYESIGDISTNVVTKKLADLSGYKDILLVVRPADREENVPETIVEEFTSKLTSAFSSPSTGFDFETRQDLKELIYASLMRGDGEIGPTDADIIREKSGAQAIAVADIASVNEQTTFLANESERLTKPYPPFSEPRPVKPSKPHYNDKVLFGGYIYKEIDGSRRNDPRYERDLKEYDRDLRDYRSDLWRWERRRDNYEDSRNYHRMEWKTSVDRVETVRVNANIRIYDLEKYRVGDAGKVIFSCPIYGGAKLRTPYNSEVVTVVGEYNAPDTPNVPQAHTGVKDQSVVSQAFIDAAGDALVQVSENSVLPSDRSKSAIFISSETTGECTEVRAAKERPDGNYIDIFATGTITLSQEPINEGLNVAREAAANDAFAQMLAKIRAVFPMADITIEGLRQKAELVSDNWDEATNEFVVTMRFSGLVEKPGKWLDTGE